MADPISSLVSGGVSGFADAFKTIWSTFKLTPEQKAAADAAIEANKDRLEEIDQQYKIKVLDSNVALNETASKNLVADAESGDAWVRRARPSVIWMGNILLFWNYAIIPFFGAHWHLVPVSIPDAFYWTWGTCVTGYVFARTIDKNQGGAGGSIQLPGIKLDSKGDK